MSFCQWDKAFNNLCHTPVQNIPSISISSGDRRPNSFLLLLLPAAASHIAVSCIFCSYFYAHCYFPGWHTPSLSCLPVDPFFLFKALSRITSSELLFRQSCLDCPLYDNHSLCITRLLNSSYNIANICLCQWFSMGEGRSISSVLQKTFGGTRRNFLLSQLGERRCYGSGGLRSGMMQNILQHTGQTLHKG